MGKQKNQNLLYSLAFARRFDLKPKRNPKRHYKAD